mmetsp:Transcript_60657/g.100714  ORF Transcript_60657/g.100714 Transcript_60657/m.100714 type:complete len:101 (+) Transcript_60657:805-1107(+)
MWSCPVCALEPDVSSSLRLCFHLFHSPAQHVFLYDLYTSLPVHAHFSVPLSPCVWVLPLVLEWVFECSCHFGVHFCGKHNQELSPAEPSLAGPLEGHTRA